MSNVYRLELVSRLRVTGDDLRLFLAGSLLTSDAGGPYNLTLLPVQQGEVKCELQAKSEAVFQLHRV